MIETNLFEGEKMAKRQMGWTEKKIAKYYKEGRGSGELSCYKPWLTVQDVQSRGRSHRPKGWKTNRIHQLLSDLEFNYFCLLEWADDVVDIREQFPLNRELTLNIAESKNINYSVDTQTRTPIVMTTDFLITVRRNSELDYLARTVKHTKELSDRQIEKFEIERAYWEGQGINWGIVTEKELSSVAIDNIKWLHKSYFEKDSSDQEMINQLLYYLSEQGQTIIRVLSEFDENYKLEQGEALSLFKWLVANKIIKINIHKKFDLKHETSVLLIPDINLSETRWAT